MPCLGQHAGSTNYVTVAVCLPSRYDPNQTAGHASLGPPHILALAPPARISPLARFPTVIPVSKDPAPLSLGETRFLILPLRRSLHRDQSRRGGRMKRVQEPTFDSYSASTAHSPIHTPIHSRQSSPQLVPPARAHSPPPLAKLHVKDFQFRPYFFSPQEVTRQEFLLRC